MEANRKLEDSLKRFVKKFQELSSKHLSELEPIGCAVEAINTSSPRPESFVSDLLKFSSAVNDVRSSKGAPAALKELPMPPYDLWLPFKAKGKLPEPETLTDVSDIFAGKINEIVWFWRIVRNINPPSPPSPPDPELLQLTQSINAQFNYCNTCCYEAAKFRLFNPSQEIVTELFASAMPSPASSARDFHFFILAVFKVFVEGLPNNIRRWRPGQQLEGPLTQVAEVLDGEALNQLSIIRHKLTHDYSGNPPPELAQAFESLIGVRTIAPDDAPTWLRLQKKVLTILSQVLRDVCGVFEASQKNSQK